MPAKGKKTKSNDICETQHAPEFFRLLMEELSFQDYPEKVRRIQMESLSWYLRKNQESIALDMTENIQNILLKYLLLPEKMAVLLDNNPREFL